MRERADPADPDDVPRWVLGMLVLVRMVIIPVILIAITVAAAASLIPDTTTKPNAQLIKLILVLQVIRPDAVPHGKTPRCD